MAAQIGSIVPSALSAGRSTRTPGIFNGLAHRSWRYRFRNGLEPKPRGRCRALRQRSRPGRICPAPRRGLGALGGSRSGAPRRRRHAHRLRVVLASSSPEDELEHYLELLDARELADAWPTKDDVSATKPEPDLVRAALGKAGSENAVMVGDTTWDIEAARKARIETICVITGGWSEQELRDAGAAAVFESAEDLRHRLDQTPLGK